MPPDSKTGNPYDKSTPEWQLFEGMKSAEKLIETYSADADRYMQKAAEQRVKFESYQKALEKLNAE